MSPWLRTLGTFSEVLGLIPSAPMAAHHCLKFKFQEIHMIPSVFHGMGPGEAHDAAIHAKKTFKHIK